MAVGHSSTSCLEERRKFFFCSFFVLFRLPIVPNGAPRVAKLCDELSWSRRGCWSAYLTLFGPWSCWSWHALVLFPVFLSFALRFLGTLLVQENNCLPLISGPVHSHFWAAFEWSLVRSIWTSIGWEKRLFHFYPLYLLFFPYHSTRCQSFLLVQPVFLSLLVMLNVAPVPRHAGWSADSFSAVSVPEIVLACTIIPFHSLSFISFHSTRALRAANL